MVMSVLLKRVFPHYNNEVCIQLLLKEVCTHIQSILKVLFPNEAFKAFKNVFVVHNIELRIYLIRTKELLL